MMKTKKTKKKQKKKKKKNRKETENNYFIVVQSGFVLSYSDLASQQSISSLRRVL